MLGMSWMLPDQASSYAPEVDHLYLFLVGLTVFFTALIGGAIFFFFVKYRRRPNTPIPTPIEGSIILESAWSIIPFIICLFIFAWGTKIYLEQYTIPNDALDIYVVGKQWMWKLQHMEGQREINELHVPAGRPVRLTMTSEDVIHSFFVPAFRTKQDVVPGRYTTTWFEATKPGKYHLFCAEYCGANHSGMGGWIYVMEPQDYQTWLSGGTPGATLAENGEKLFENLACANCHKADGSGRCPALGGLFGKDVKLADGSTVKADEGYIRESILRPAAKIVAGYQPVMPTFQGLVTEEGVLQLVEYIKSLGPTLGAGQAEGLAVPGNK